MKRTIHLFVSFFLFAVNGNAQTALVSYGSTWKYLDNGSNQGTAWRATVFNDASWVSGPAQLGYGDGDEATVVSYGPNANKKYITTYFRKTITVADASVYSSYRLNVKRDDGVVVYINGTERFRSNMPTGNISHTTKASSDAADDGNTPQSILLVSGALISGTNVIAVEIHQRAANNNDISFDLELTGQGDLIPPSVSNYSPGDNATNVSASANLVLTFNETIQKGTGNIVVKESGIATQTIDVNSTEVTVSGNTATINPADYTFAADINIEIGVGAFKDLANNNYSGISDPGTWNFTVIAPDLTPPTVNIYSPEDNATNIAASANLVLTFNETIQKGTGNIVVKQGGIVTQTIDVNSAVVTVSGNTATINPSDFAYNASVNIEITTGTFKDLANNNYTGISDATIWNFSVQAPPSGPETLVAFGTSWKYLDNGTNQGTAWRSTSFSDASWASGNAQLGYGDGDEATIVSYGPNASNKYITTYFRKTISVSNPGSFASIAGSVRRDDGIAIYVNGIEVYRNNLAAGATYTTLATLAGDDGATEQAFSFSPSVFVSGSNVVAVEIHQNAVTSSDISFDLQLIGTVPGAALLTRGPYLNMGNETAITVRWRTDIATNSRVEVGTTHGNYPIVANDANPTTEHEVRITGLSSDTKYFYRFGSSSQSLQAGVENYFTTAPPSTTTRKLRFAAYGDCGRNDNGFQTGTLNSYLSFVGSNPAEAMLLLGDNAYNNGLDAEYQTGYFNVYSPTILKNHQLFPAPGNHDYANSASRQADHNIPYYSIFTNPANAECGGVASATEAYYSWDWGNVHFLSLDSYGKENGGTTRLYDTTGAQAVWIKQDLAANTKPWVIAYWHHPPYTMGSHNSDTETELINMRQNFIRILERLGVDLILCGHSHDYERSFLLNGYYGNESSFNVGTHTLSSSSAKYNGTANSCTYTTTNGQNHGTVYVVAGSAGADGGIQSGYPHNALPWSIDDGGMIYFEVEDNRLDAKFIRRNGAVDDQFTIMKNVNKTTNLTIPSGTPTQLTASWVGNYNWNTTETTRSISVAPASNTSYTVTDGLSCLTDIFNITVTGGERNININTAPESVFAATLKLIPSLVQRGQPVYVQTNITGPSEAVILDINGRIVQVHNFNNTLSIETNKMHSGVYFIRLNGKYKSQPQKFVVID